jgi:hypothetical protein
MRRRTTLFLTGGLAILGTFLSVAIALGSGARHGLSQPRSATAVVHTHARAPMATPSGATHVRSGTRRHALRRVDRALMRHFGLLRRSRARAAGGSVSASTETTVANALSGLVTLHATYGADPSQAGETAVGAANDDVWLVPGSSGACLVDVEGPQGAGSACNKAAAVEAGDLWTLDTIPYGAGGAMTKVLLGAVPDGNASVTIAWADGAATVVPVTHNVYSVPIGSHTGWKSVTLKNSAGATVAASGMPSLP